MQGKAPNSSAIPTSSADSSALQKNITLKKDQISKDVVFRKTAAADGEIVLTSDQIEKIEVKPSCTAQNSSIYDITFYLTEASCKQFAEASRKMAEANGELSIWGKNGQVASGKVADPIEGGIFVLSGFYSFEEATQRLDSFCSDADAIG